jgi:hypothetical protein
MVKKAKNIIFGVDPEGEFTPADVKEAIIKCFAKAHDPVLSQIKDYSKYTEGEISQEDFEKIKREQVEAMVRKTMDEKGGNFENPTKEDLKSLCDGLAEFAKNFRDQKMISQNYSKIMKLIEKL